MQNFIYTMCSVKKKKTNLRNTEKKNVIMLTAHRRIRGDFSALLHF